MALLRVKEENGKKGYYQLTSKPVTSLYSLASFEQKACWFTINFELSGEVIDTSSILGCTSVLATVPVAYTGYHQDACSGADHGSGYGRLR